MAVPDYTTDLQTFELCAGSVNFLPEFSGLAGGRSETDDTDYEIQGSDHVSKQYNATGLGSLGIEYPTGPGDPVAGWVSGWNFFMWGVFLPAGAVETYAAGGLRMIVGSDSNNHRQWIVGGSDFGSYPYGGWQNFVVDPETSGDYTDTGTYTSDYGVVGLGVNVIAAISKGNPMGIDAIRYGRGEIRAVAGSVGDGYADFDGMATENDLNANMWGLFQKIPGGYLFKGKMVLGYGALVDFKATNVNIVIDDTRKVLASFNRIEITTAGSTIDWTNISITSLGTVAKGELEMMDNATFDDTGGVFTDMSTFIYLSNATINGRTWRRCGLVTQGGGDFDNCVFDEASGAVALLVDNPDNIDNCTFNSDGTGHAIELTTDCAGNSYTLTDLWVSGYASSDGSTGNEVIFNNSGGAVTINIDGGSGVSNISVMDGSGASTTLVANFSFTIAGLELNTEVTIVTADTTTVLHHTENATTSDGEGKYQITYSHSGGASVDVLIHHVDYLPEISNIYGLTLPSNNSSAKASMFDDLNYYNP
jgi:hypothetical protein